MGNNKKKKKSAEKIYEFFIKHERPEEYAKDPLKFYTPKRVQEYAQSKALMRIQEKITKRVLEISEVEPPGMVLDLGMGCGFSTTLLFLLKYRTVGIDLNRLFLKFYKNYELNSIEAIMQSTGFRPNTFDMIISISAIQWILAIQNQKRKKVLLNQLALQSSNLLKNGGCVVFQFYPKSDVEMHELGSAFNSTGRFEGNFIIDNPGNPKKRKIYLKLMKIK
jgi:18S rRNA (guanine1575-N7)-methyltransferase